MKLKLCCFTCGRSVTLHRLLVFLHFLHFPFTKPNLPCLIGIIWRINEPLHEKTCENSSTHARHEHQHYLERCRKARLKELTLCFQGDHHQCCTKKTKRISYSVALRSIKLGPHSSPFLLQSCYNYGEIPIKVTSLLIT